MALRCHNKKNHRQTDDQVKFREGETPHTILVNPGKTHSVTLHACRVTEWVTPELPGVKLKMAMGSNFC